MRPKKSRFMLFDSILVSQYTTLMPNFSFFILNFTLLILPPQKIQLLKYAFIFRQKYITLSETLSRKDKYLCLIGANKFV